MTNVKPPQYDSVSLSPNYRFHVDGTSQNLKDCLRYLKIITESEFPTTKKQYNELREWITAFNWTYERR
jgi:hypothetical protein